MTMSMTLKLLEQMIVLVVKLSQNWTFISMIVLTFLTLPQLPIPPSTTLPLMMTYSMTANLMKLLLIQAHRFPGISFGTYFTSHAYSSTLLHQFGKSSFTPFNSSTTSSSSTTFLPPYFSGISFPTTLVPGGMTAIIASLASIVVTSKN